ncbi:MAG: HlyD family efflux transporter periplasmic adaptor subunit [Myxococcales bacterium]|nr:HlyD family efflux transporter periplasmic adaptor subunit [Myxococcales bacterium]MCB9718644.1 HlyD family efflux transporter periplasmic adaptor subunit [Myxococcales bacterium]
MSNTLYAAGSFDAARILARLLVAAVLAAVVALVVVPWQQSVPGTGRLIAYAPLERQQTIEAPIAGRLVHWAVQEGDHVEAGQLIAELSDNDPQILERLERERQAALVQVDAATLGIATAEAQIASLEGVQDAAVVGVELRRLMALDRVEAAERALDAAGAAKETAELNLTRQEALHGKGLTSTRSLELARLDRQKAAAELERAEAALRASRREAKAIAADRSETTAGAQAKIEDARAKLQSSRSARAKAEAALLDVEVRLARQQTMRITAPRAGSVFRIVAKQGGEVVKQGEALAVLVPDTDGRAVELWVDGNDAPLVTPGRHVRLQFEGWPAVQFVGWPSVAVGTFGGEVAFVDATDDGKGRFRVVVIPDGSEEWPEARYLRQGVRANGWILLNRVSLGYELWRQLNGFPPAIEAPGSADATTEAKP